MARLESYADRLCADGRLPDAVARAGGGCWRVGGRADRLYRARDDVLYLDNAGDEATSGPASGRDYVYNLQRSRAEQIAGSGDLSLSIHVQSEHRIADLFSHDKRLALLAAIHRHVAVYRVRGRGMWCVGLSPGIRSAAHAE